MSRAAASLSVLMVASCHHASSPYAIDTNVPPDSGAPDGVEPIPADARDSRAPDGAVSIPSDAASPAQADAIATPASCRVETTRPPPYPVEFAFTNQTGSTIYFRTNPCMASGPAIASCASGYAPLATYAGFTCSCSMPNCPQPGVACFNNAVAVAAGASYTLRWAGTTFLFGKAPGGQACVDRTAEAAAGRYRVSMTYFLNEADAKGVTNIYSTVGAKTVTADFGLPAPADRVSVPITSAGGP